MGGIFDPFRRAFRPDPNSIGSDGLTRLQRAIMSGEDKKALQLIEAGADVNDRGLLNYPPLHLALQRDRDFVAAKLIVAGADVNARDAHGRTPLHLAVAGAHDYIVTELLRHDAQTDLRNNDGFAPVHLLAGSLGLDILHHLKRAGADLDARTPRGDTALGLFLNRPEVARTLMALGANPNLRNNNGASPAARALDDERLAADESFLCAMVEAGADIDTTSAEGNSFISTAITRHHDMLFSLCLARGANIRRRHLGSHLLHTAIDAGNLMAVERLLARAPELATTAGAGLFPMPMQRLMNAFATSPRSFGRDRYEKIARLLIDAGADIETLTRDGETLMTQAALGKRASFMSFLISRGANIDRRNMDDKAAIHILVDQGNMNMLDELLDAGADPDQPDKRGWTILDRLAEKNDRESPVVQRLIVAGGQYKKQLPLRPEFMRQAPPPAPVVPPRAPHDRPAIDSTQTHISKPIVRRPPPPANDSGDAGTDTPARNIPPAPKK